MTAGLDLDALTAAIDMHVHAEVSSRGGGSLPAVLASCSKSTICRNSRDFTSYRCGPRVMYRT